MYKVYIYTIILLWFGNYLRMLGLGLGHMRPAHLRGNHFISFLGIFFITIGLFLIPSCLGYTIYDQLGWIDYLSDRLMTALDLKSDY